MNVFLEAGCCNVGSVSMRDSVTVASAIERFTSFDVS